MLAQFNMDFGDLVIVQGTKGRIVSEKDDPLFVRWDGIGDRPAAPSQLVLADSSLEEDQEEFFLPVMGRKAEAQVAIKEEKKADEGAQSIAKTEDNKAKKVGKGKGKAKGKRKTGKVASAEVDVTV